MGLCGWEPVEELGPGVGWEVGGGWRPESEEVGHLQGASLTIIPGDPQSDCIPQGPPASPLLSSSLATL